MVCAVNGACVSGALEVALSASFVVASEQARFADTHARVGLLPGWGLTVELPRAIGVRRARQMSFTGNFMGADEAHAYGLVNHVVHHGELLPFTRSIAADICGNEQDVRLPVVGDVPQLEYDDSNQICEDPPAE